jgi:hypothetical protein
MQISIDQLTTIVSTAALGDFEERKRRKTDLYFHIVLRMDGDLIEGEKLLLLKRYIAGYVRATGGAVQAIAAGGGRVEMLARLPVWRSPSDFISALKIAAGAFARRRAGAQNFRWRESYDIYTVGFSEIESIKIRLGRRRRRSFREYIVVPGTQRSRMPGRPFWFYGR